MPGIDSSGTAGICDEICPRDSAQGGLLRVVIIFPSLLSIFFELKLLPGNLNETNSFATVPPINSSWSGDGDEPGP
jgi:hypothetical protein